MAEKIVPAHDDVRRLLEVIHYPEHAGRTESEEFIKLRAEFHHDGAKCHIDNGMCEGQIEIHHSVIEYSAANEVDWEKVNQELGFDHVDAKAQMWPLCHKHHMGVGTGVHMVTGPAWLLQKYLRPEALALFEAAIQHLKNEGHEDHIVNHAAKQMLMHLNKRGAGQLPDVATQATHA